MKTPRILVRLTYSPQLIVKLKTAGSLQAVPCSFALTLNKYLPGASCTREITLFEDGVLQLEFRSAARFDPFHEEITKVLPEDLVCGAAKFFRRCALVRVLFQKVLQRCEEFFVALHHPEHVEHRGPFAAR